MQNKPTNIKAIIFDCFGVLVSDALEAILITFRRDNPNVVDKIVAIVHAASRGEITSEESSARIALLLGSSVKEYRNRIENGEVKNQELLEFVATLRKKYKTAVLSNVTIGGLATRFPDHELDTYFDVVVASGDIGYAKPQAQAYEITADTLGVRLDECVFIDDRQEYLDGAAAVGMQTILFRSNEGLTTNLAALGIYG